MPCFLFDKIVFGPVLSRRLGVSLGVNLLPTDKKICTFNCIYCECGWTRPGAVVAEKYPEVSQVLEALEEKFAAMKGLNEKPDNITFSGNGEPTLHPDFEAIIDGLLILRNAYFPDVRISVLSNATTLNQASVVRALKKVDNPILKLDAGNSRLFMLMNRPLVFVSEEDVVKNIIEAAIPHTIIQTMFLKGFYEGEHIDNTTEEALQEWLEKIELIQPSAVMIYSLDRDAPAIQLEKMNTETMKAIAERVEKRGFKVNYY